MGEEEEWKYQHEKKALKMLVSAEEPLNSCTLLHFYANQRPNSAPNLEQIFLEMGPNSTSNLVQIGRKFVFEFSPNFTRTEPKFFSN